MKLIVRMQLWARRSLLCLLFAAALVLPQAKGVRAWSGDPTVNTPICTTSGEQQSPGITTDGSGGAIITITDSQ